MKKSVLAISVCFMLNSYTQVLGPVAPRDADDAFALGVIKRNITQDHGGVYTKGTSLGPVKRDPIPKNKTQKKFPKTQQKKLQKRPIQSKPKTPVLTRGEKRVKEMLKKNREKLARMRGEKSPGLSGKEKIQKMLAENRRKLKERKSVEKVDPRNPYANLRKKHRQGLMKWKKANNETYAQWNREHQDFLKRVSEYKDALYKFNYQKISKAQVQKKRTVDFFNMESTSREVRKKAKKKSKRPSENLGSNQAPLRAFVVDQAFETRITDQGPRPTCAAFSAIHAIEILLNQNNRYQKLSEQFFYYASKPRCRKSPCNKRGSWVTEGLKYSQTRAIPTEEDCPYNKDQMGRNETQIPLSRSCYQGRVSVRGQLKLETLNDIARALKKNIPVIAGFRLSENFYNNRGLVLLSEAGGVSARAHGKGHAVTLVGVMEMPHGLRSQEGDVCYLVANSWGTGWGIGGHACVSEAWLKKFRFPMAFVGIDSIEVIN